MLDTNTASYVIKGKPAEIRENLAKVPMQNVYISVITEAELRHGIARRPDFEQLLRIVSEFLLRVEILPWDSDAAVAYVKFKSACEKEGKSLGVMDMLIAAHSIATDMVLVTSDKAFDAVSHILKLDDWTKKH